MPGDSKDKHFQFALPQLPAVALTLTCCSFVLWKSLSHHSTLSELLPLPCSGLSTSTHNSSCFHTALPQFLS